MDKCLSVLHSPFFALDLYVPQKEIRLQLESLARFVRRYAPTALSVELRTRLFLNDFDSGYSPAYELTSITARLPGDEYEDVLSILQKRFDNGWRPPQEDPEGAWFWERVLLEEGNSGSGLDELIEPLVLVFANPFAHKAVFTINLEDLERNLTAVEDVAAMQPGLTPCEGSYPALARNALFKFVRNHTPDARKVRVQYTLGIVEYDDALYLNYELKRIDVECRSGKSVWLDDIIEKRAEKDPDFVKNASNDPWTEALLEQDATGIHELLAPLVRGYAHDPNLKHGAIELEL